MIETEDEPTGATMATQSMLIKVDDIVRGGHNPNGRIQGPAYDEFREDVRKHGVLQAVLVRPARDEEGPKGQTAYFLIAGHRRVQAAIDTMLEEIPAVVIGSEPGSDDELRLIENIHRADLDPVTEAEAYRAMAKTFGADGPEEIATRVGKSVSHVRRRLSLLRVSKKVLESVSLGELPVRVAELVGSVDDEKLRAKAGEEALMFTYERRPATVSEMREWLAEHTGHLLRTAPWDVTDEHLYGGDPCKGSCRPCPFNTENQGELFGDVGKEAACMNAKGWAAKSKAFFDRRAAAVKAAGGTVLSSIEGKALARGNSAGKFVKASDVCHQDSKYRTFGELAGKDLGLRAIAMVDGEIVEAVDGKAVLAAAKAKGATIGPGPGSSSSLTASEKRKREKAKHERSTVAVALERVVAEAEAALTISPMWLLEQILIHSHHEQRRTVCARRGWIPEKKKGAGGGWSPDAVLKEQTKVMTSAAAAGLVVEILATPSFPGNTRGIESACKEYGVNWEALLKQAESAGPGKCAMVKRVSGSAAKKSSVLKKSAAKPRGSKLHPKAAAKHARKTKKK